MKKVLTSGICFFAALVILFFSSCQKNPGDLKPPPNVDPAIVNAMYPVTQSYYDGVQSAYPTVNKIEYDKDNHINWFGKDSSLYRVIGAHQVDVTSIQYTTQNNRLVLWYGSVTSYVFNLVGTTNSPVDLYNTAPTQVTYTYFNKNWITGISTSTPGGQWQFENNKDGLPLKEITSDGGGRNYNFSYDDNGNLKMAEFVSLTGPRAGAVYDRMTVTSVDDKPSPFSSVKGYFSVSYPQAYSWDFALALCKNNPKQTKDEIYDATKNAYVPYEQDDYTYTYNDKGYPTQIVINTTYFTAVTTHYVKTYNYTYK